MAPKVLADAKSIGFDGNDQQAFLDQFNSNQNINQEVSPKYVKKMGVHRRNKTTGNASVLAGQQLYKYHFDENRKPAIKNHLQSKTLEESKSYADS